MIACSKPLPPQPPPPIVVGTFVGQPGIGLPAIHHHGKGMPTSGEVRQFILSHPFPGGKPVSGRPAPIDALLFMSAGAADARLQNILRGRRLHLFDTATVIDVELGGPFAVTTGPSWVKRPIYVKNAVEVFDGATGNLLFYWP